MSADAVERTLIICNAKGLHARAAAQFVRCAERFGADITVSRDGQTVPARSIMGLLMLSASCGSQIAVSAQGEDAAQAVDALDQLVAGKFGEDGDQKEI